MRSCSGLGRGPTAESVPSIDFNICGTCGAANSRYGRASGDRIYFGTLVVLQDVGAALSMRKSAPSRNGTQHPIAIDRNDRDMPSIEYDQWHDFT